MSMTSNLTSMAKGSLHVLAIKWSRYGSAIQTSLTPAFLQNLWACKRIRVFLHQTTHGRALQTSVANITGPFGELNGQILNSEALLLPVAMIRKFVSTKKDQQLRE